MTVVKSELISKVLFKSITLNSKCNIMEEYVTEIPACRVCLQPAMECIEMDAFMTNEYGDEESQTYFECLNSCTHLDIKADDRLPKHICALCAKELRAANDFIIKVRNSNEILQMQMEDIKPEYIIHEFDPERQDITEETIFLPVENTEEIFEEEPDELCETVFKVEEDTEESNKDEEQYIDDDRLADDSVSIEHNVFGFSSENDELTGIKSRLHIKNVDDSLSGDTNQCNLCHIEFERLEDLKEHGDFEHSTVPFSCSVCCHRFSTKSLLASHMKHCHSGAYATCDICGTSVKRTFLRAHKRQVHRKAPFLCSACPRTFKTTAGLQIHSETHKENRQRNFECEHCHKKFLTERTYKVHIRTHWHREPFKCNLCEKQFMQKVNLRLHMQMHRGETMDCMYCDKKFVRKTDLSVHLRFHTGNFPYECQYCEKRFAIVSHLNYHQKRHQGYIYKCDVCDKEFINMSGLRNHSFQHTSMPFNCAVCDKGFPTRFKIKRHLKTVHHVEDNDELERFITTEKIKIETNLDEGNEEILLEETDGRVDSIEV